MKLSKEQLEKLKEQLPQQAIKQHPTKPYLSSIKAIYVTERFNDVFGVGAWTADAKVVDPNEGAPVLYVTFEVPEYDIKLSQFGGNDNGGQTSKNYDLGDAYKGAMTDALTKIGSYLGIGADVFKGEQNHNTKTETTKKSAPKTTKKSEAPKKEEPKVDDVAQPYLDQAKKAKNRKEAVEAFTSGMNDADAKEAVKAIRQDFMDIINSLDK